MDWRSSAWITGSPRSTPTRPARTIAKPHSSGCSRRDPSEFGADRAFIGGESAGGHLTLVTGLRARDRLGVLDRVLGLNLVFGWYDVNGTPSQRGNNGLPDMLDPEGLRFMVDCFTPRTLGRRASCARYLTALRGSPGLAALPGLGRDGGPSL